MYTKILVPVDGSPTSDLGLAEAVKLARISGARLRLIHAVDMLSLSLTPEAGMVATPTLFEMFRQGGEAILTRAKASVDKSGVPVDAVLVDSLRGRVSDMVVDEATKWDADLIVIGTHGRRGLGRMLMGSDAEQILRQAPVPVLLVRAKPA